MPLSVHLCMAPRSRIDSRQSAELTEEARAIPRNHVTMHSKRALRLGQPGDSAATARLLPGRSHPSLSTLALL